MRKNLPVLLIAALACVLMVAMGYSDNQKLQAATSEAYQNGYSQGYEDGKKEGAAETTVVSSGNSSSGSSYVWVSYGGKKYHKDPGCAGSSPKKIALAEAKADGRTPCKKCW